MASSLQLLSNLSYQYPLKLITPNPSTLLINRKNVHFVFILNYGGGIVAGDCACLEVNQAKHTRLVLFTQGSTKIFKSPDPFIISSQNIRMKLGQKAFTFYLPEPVQPFSNSSYKQSLIVQVESSIQKSMHQDEFYANVFICDWVSNGRSARNEHWHLRDYTSTIELWNVSDGQRHLLIRDNLSLKNDHGNLRHTEVYNRFNNSGIFGTIIIHGPGLSSLGCFFTDEFKYLRKTEAEIYGPTTSGPINNNYLEEERFRRQRLERLYGVCWTVSFVRNVFVIKFSAKSTEGAKGWLKAMLIAEGTVAREFGERAFMPLS